jgi:hypothetical protein
VEQEQEQSNQLIERLAELGDRDREAVLSRMSHEERGEVENALKKHLEDERLEEERQQRIDSQFLGYSAWLASLIEEAQEDAPERLSETCGKALWEIHSAKVGDGMTLPSTGWQGFVDRINEWLSPSKEQHT